MTTLPTISALALSMGRGNKGSSNSREGGAYLRTGRNGEVPALRGERAADGSGNRRGKGQWGRRMGTVMAQIGGGGVEREGFGEPSFCCVTETGRGAVRRRETLMA
jgi:hypothetical protein